MSTRSIFGYGFLALCMATAVGCSSGGKKILGDGETITVSGNVFSIDTGQPAAGVRVYVLDNEDVASETETGADGAFSIDMPAGTSNLLVTDDPEGNTDDWFPTINYEIFGGLDVAGFRTDTFEEDTSGIIIHSCPQPESPDILSWAENPAHPRDDTENLGTIVTFDNYFANATENTVSDLFGIESSIGGSAFLFHCSANTEEETFSFLDGMQLESDNDNCQVGYIDGAQFFEPNFVPDATLMETSIFHAASTDTTDASGSAYSICHEGEEEFELTITDTSDDRDVDWGGPFEIPVRDGFLTLFLNCEVDGTAGSTFFEAYCSVFPC